MLSLRTEACRTMARQMSISEFLDEIDGLGTNQQVVDACRSVEFLKEYITELFGNLVLLRRRDVRTADDYIRLLRNLASGAMMRMAIASDEAGENMVHGPVSPGRLPYIPTQYLRRDNTLTFTFDLELEVEPGMIGWYVGLNYDGNYTTVIPTRDGNHGVAFIGYPEDLQELTTIVTRYMAEMCAKFLLESGRKINNGVMYLDILGREMNVFRESKQLIEELATLWGAAEISRDSINFIGIEAVKPGDVVGARGSSWALVLCDVAFLQF